MSSTIVRNEFKAALLAGFPALPQFDTIGVRVDNNALPPLWASVDVIGIDDLPISLGDRCRRETGTFRVHVVGATGGGYDTVLSTADAILEYFRSWSGLSGNLRTMGAVPPSPSDQSDGRWLIAIADMTYRNDYT